MGAFELQDTEQAELMRYSGHGKIKDECLIVFKVYDNCRSQVCLTPRDIGPAMLCDPNVETIVTVPDTASGVTIDHLRIAQVTILDKQPSPFRSGYWDVDIKYAIEYRLTFREVDGTVIDCVKAYSVYNTRVGLFGSVGNDLVVATDLLRKFTDKSTFEAGPFVYVEAQAVSLNANINREHRRGELYSMVHVSIGLFSIIKLFRLVNLNVQSKGFCIPKECEEVSNINPCEYFDDLDFPMDLFAPPQHPEFVAGVSANVPRSGKGAASKGTC